MKKLSFIIYIIAALSIFISSCDEKCETDKSLGSFGFREKDKLFLTTYKNKKKVVFKDTLDNESSFSIIFNTSFYDLKRKVELQNCPDYYFILNLENISVELNNSNGILIDIGLVMNPIGAEFKTDREDKLGICIPKNGNNNLCIPIFDEILYSNVKAIDLKKTTQPFLGKIYDDVLVDKDDKNPKCYLHESVGILAFRDLNNKLWVFDRFE